jgi:phosphoribosylglycinamide formyltransferase-1
MNSPSNEALHPVAVMVSGTGRHLDHLAQLSSSAELPVDIRLCISSRHGVAALEHARRWDIPCQVPDEKRELTAEAYSALIFSTLEEAGVRTLILAGFLRFLPIPDAWQNRVLNIHPSLLPSFGGAGFYGHHVHDAVLKRGCKVSGCTVHYVDNVFDHGPILVQRTCPVLPGDNSERLASRVFEEELIAYPAALRLHLANG